jgi:hypothetical protein
MVQETVFLDLLSTMTMDSSATVKKHVILLLALLYLEHRLIVMMETLAHLTFVMTIGINASTCQWTAPLVLVVCSIPVLAPLERFNATEQTC